MFNLQEKDNQPLYCDYFNKQYFTFEDFQDGIIQHILAHRDSMNDNNPTSCNISTNRTGLYFISTTFECPEQRKSDNLPLKPERCFHWFTQFYVHSLSKIMGNNYQRKNKRPYQPLVYAFLDFPGTKKYKKFANQSEFKKKILNRDHRSGGLGVAGEHPENSPHIHSIWSVPPRNIQRFDEVSDGFEGLFQSLNGLNRTLDVQDISLDDLGRRFVYSSAAMRNRNLTSKLDADLYNIFPTSKYGPTYIQDPWEIEVARKIKEDRNFRNKNVTNYKKGNFNFGERPKLKNTLDKFCP
jgi:hypothetical protein